MFAYIKPLEGKYYGTVVVVQDKDHGDTEVVFWNQETVLPSKRELEPYGVSPENLDPDMVLTDKETGEKIPYEDLVCDCHYETQYTYALAKFFAEAINKQSRGRS